MTKKIIRCRFHEVQRWFDMSDFTGSTNDIRKFLDRIDILQKEFGYHDVKIEFESTGAYGESSLMATGSRLENDEEYTSRLKTEKKQKKIELAAAKT